MSRRTKLKIYRTVNKGYEIREWERISWEIC
jgi:hypothetical protein